MSTTVDVRELSDQSLRLLAQGCTELTCIHHGGYNAELHRRHTTAPAQPDQQENP